MRWLHFNISYLSCKALCKMDIFSVAAISEQIRQCLDVSPKKNPSGHGCAKHCRRLKCSIPVTCLNISYYISLQQSLSPNHQRLRPHSSDKFQSQTNHLGHAESLNTNVRGLYYFQYSLTLLMMWPLAHSQQKKVQLYFFQLKNLI